MDFARDFGAFIFPSGLETSREGAELLTGIFERLFGGALFRNIAETADEAQGFAEAITNDESPIEDGGITFVLATKTVFTAPGLAAASTALRIASVTRSRSSG